MDLRKFGRRAALAASALMLGGAAVALERGGGVAGGPGGAGWHGGPEWRWHRHGGGDSGCARGGRLDPALAAVRDSLALAPAQEGAWVQFAAVVRAATARWDEACGAVGDESSAVARGFARAEAALAWLGAVRPAHDRLARALDDGQRRTLEGWWARGRRS